MRISHRKPEVCNGVDDDCDGQTDEDLEDDSYEPNESCSTASDLGDVTQERLYQVMLYPQDDEDWFFIRGLESDQNICNLCDVVDGASATQSYRATFSLLDVPADLDVALSVSADQRPTPTAPNDNAFVITSPTTAEEEEGLAERMYIRLQHDCQTESIDTLTCTLLLLYRESFGYSDEQLANELIGLGFEGNKLGCGFLDWRDYFINIRTTNDTQTCQPFTLRVTYESL